MVETDGRNLRFGATSGKENAMTLIRHVFVVHTTHALKDAETNAGFELIIKGPGFEVHRDFKDLAYNEREKGRTDLYMFEFDEPFDWDNQWTASIRMKTTKNGWLPFNMFILGKVASDIPREWVVMGAHVPWPIDQWFDRGPPAADEHPEHAVSGFTWGLGI
jgi:hypothetical protein